MPRKPGYDPQKIARILAVMVKYPEGLWLRKLAREAGMTHATAGKYISGPLAPMIEITALGEKPLLKVVRLKPAVVQKLSEGMTIEQVMRLMNILEKAIKES